MDKWNLTSHKGDALNEAFVFWESWRVQRDGAVSKNTSLSSLACPPARNSQPLGTPSRQRRTRQDNLTQTLRLWSTFTLFTAATTQLIHGRLFTTTAIMAFSPQNWRRRKQKRGIYVNDRVWFMFFKFDDKFASVRVRLRDWPMILGTRSDLDANMVLICKIWTQRCFFLNKGKHTVYFLLLIKPFCCFSLKIL